MESPDWEACSLELARHLVDEGSLKIANRRITNEEKLRTLRHVAVRRWNGEALGAVGPVKLSVITRGAFRDPHTRELGQALKIGYGQLGNPHTSSSASAAVCSARASGRESP